MDQRNTIFYWKYLYPILHAIGAMIHPTFVTWLYYSLNRFVPELVRTLACSSYNYYDFFFQIFNSLHWIPWQIPHQRFQQFDFPRICKCARNTTLDWLNHMIKPLRVWVTFRCFSIQKNMENRDIKEHSREYLANTTSDPCI